MSESLLATLRPARMRLDLDRLAANYLAVAAAAGRPVMPVVKADAYGHGAARVSRHLVALGAPMLAVAFAEEGVVLRSAGIRAPIVVLAGFAPGQVRWLVQHDLTPVVSTPSTLEGALQAAKEAGRPFAIHLKVDTGMTRLGFTPSAVGETAARLVESGRVEVEGIMTHLAAADEDPEATRRQLDLFDEAVEDLARRGIRPRWIHAANSAGLAFLRRGHTLVRPGLILYGVRPRPLAPAIDVKPVMSVSADIELVKDVAVGTPVSYGGRWVAPRRSRIATIPFGYADGVPRTDAMADRGELLVKGRRVPVAGTVCMDLTMADLTDHPDAGEGDEAVLFGDDPIVWDVADCAGTNAWEVLTGVGTRMPRVYIEGGRVVGVESRFTPRGTDPLGRGR
jgi:alanine racemase